MISSGIIQNINKTNDTWVSDPINWWITRLGIEYFKENSLITKTYKQRKEIKDWSPLT
ncbi:YjcQ family protein [Ligilactobacillus hayakitensis]|uniref:YjcQ family protein n=1 Tax=Ligilactobacillus hayakitensis TaxID=396716 RepID=UPI0009DED321